MLHNCVNENTVRRCALYVPLWQAHYVFVALYGLSHLSCRKNASYADEMSK
jgi:hypothetical protein